MMIIVLAMAVAIAMIAVVYLFTIVMTTVLISDDAGDVLCVFVFSHARYMIDMLVF